MDGSSLTRRLAAVTAAGDPTAPLSSRMHLIRAMLGDDAAAASSGALSAAFDLCLALLRRPDLSEALTAAACALVLLEQQQPPPSPLVLRQLLQQAFLPLAAAADGSAGSSQLLHQVALQLGGDGSWQLVLEMVQCAHDNLEARTVQATPPPAASISRTGVAAMLPALTACMAAREFITVATEQQQQQQQAAAAAAAGSGDSSSAVQAVLRLAAGPMFGCACTLLCSSEAALRAAAFQQLLPVLLQAAAAAGPATQQTCLQQLWQQCLSMIAQPTASRRMGLAVLLQYWDAWGISPPSADQPAAAAAAAAAAGVEAAPAGPAAPGCEQARFWALLRECLADAEPLNRKRALRLLQLLLPEAVLQRVPAWGVFLAVYELLDEFAPHLVKSAWPAVSLLHPAAPEFAETQDAAADVARGQTLNKLRRSRAEDPSAEATAAVAAATAAVAAAAASSPDQAAAAGDLHLPFCWMSVLWALALQHKNLQVQRMAFKTLLKRRWTPTLLAQVPVSFFSGVLLPALLSPIHHRTTKIGLGAAGAPAGTADDEDEDEDGDAAAAPQQAAAGLSFAHTGAADASAGSFNIISQAAALLRSFVLASDAAAVRELLSSGLQLLATPGLELPRTGLLAALTALGSAAQAAVSSARLFDGLDSQQAVLFAESCLCQVQTVLGRTSCYSGLRFRSSCFNLVLAMGAAVAPVHVVGLAAVLNAAQMLPAWLQCPGGLVCDSLRTWLLGSSGDSDSSDSSDSSSSSGTAAPSSEWLAVQADRLWQQYFATSCSRDGSGPAGGLPEACDYASWSKTCDAWLRVVLVCGDKLQQQLPAAAVDLCSRTDHISSRSYLSPGAAERCLLMLTAVFEGAVVAAGVAVSSGREPPALVSAAVQLAVAVQTPLGRCLSHTCLCFRSQPADLVAAGPATHAGGTAGRHSGLSPAAWAAAAQAEAAAHAAAAAAELLARQAAAAWAAPAGAEGEAAEPGGCSDAGALAVLMQLQLQLAEAANQLASKPLPTAAPPAAEQQQPQQLLHSLCQAAAAEQSRTKALKVLSHISRGLSRSFGCCPASLAVARAQSFAPASWLQWQLQQVAAAVDARSSWQAASAAAAAGAGDAADRGGWTEVADWACVDALLALLARSADQAAAAAVVVSGQLLAGTPVVPSVCAVLVQAVEALQWTHSEAGGELVHLLRCLRQVWHLINGDAELQASALQALESAGLVCASGGDGGSLGSIAAVLASSVLDAVRSSKKRPMLLYTSAVNTVLLPQLMVFDPQRQPLLAALHEGPAAPLRRFMRGAMHLGQRGSPRLMLLLALQLATHLPSNPWLLTCYASELRELVMFGVPGPAAGAEADTQAYPGFEEAQELSALAAASLVLDPQLQEAYTLTDIGPRLAVCCGLHALAEQAGLPGSGTAAVDSGAVSGAAAAAGAALWHSWFQAAEADPKLSGDRFKVGSEVHRLRVRAWQGLTAAAAFLTSPDQAEAARLALAGMLRELDLNNPPSIKQYHEAITATLLLSHPDLLEAQLLPLLECVAKGNATTGSYILVAVQVALHFPPDRQAVVLPRLLKLLLPWTNHHNHNVRTFAQLGFCALLERRPLAEWPGWQAGLGPGGVELAGSLLRFMTTNLEFQRFRRAMGAGMLAWSPDNVTHPQRIFSCCVHLAGPEEVPVTFEGVPEALMDRLVIFLTQERAKLREAAADRLAGFEGPPRAPAGAGDAPLPAAPDYQRKVAPHERGLLMADVLEEVDEAPGVASGTWRGELVVVASLISKATNLGGLARTAEVFGAAALVLADLRVAKEAGFTGVSVTAERWVPLLEVKEEALLAWLRAKQAEGYALVGLEQTAESVSLPQFKFPRKTILVLGREKEGVPPEVIALLDATVEIPQMGVVRSLNVHVSGAIALYEYAKQQLA